MATKTKYPKVVLPAAVAAFPWITKPDTGHKYSDNKFKVTMPFAKEDGDIMVRFDGKSVTIQEAAEEAAKIEWGSVPDDFFIAISDGDEKKQEEFHGYHLITAKSKYEPTVVDCNRNELPEGVEVRAGDLIKASAILYPFESTEKVLEKGKKKTVTTYGVSFQLRAVQLLEKRNDGGDGANDFEDETDYEPPVARASASSEGTDPEAGDDDF